MCDNLNDNTDEQSSGRDDWEMFQSKAESRNVRWKEEAEVPEVPHMWPPTHLPGDQGRHRE